MAMTREEAIQRYNTDPDFRAAVDAWRAQQQQLQQPSLVDRGVGIIKNKLQNEILERGYNSITGGGVAATAGANAAFNAGAGIASQAAYNAPAVANSLTSALSNAFQGGGQVAFQSGTGLASNLGAQGTQALAQGGSNASSGALGAYAGPVGMALAVLQAGLAIGASRRGESNLDDDDWQSLKARGFKVPDEKTRGKIGEKNAKFMASRNERDLTAEEIADTSAFRMMFPDFDSGFTREQQIALSQKANDLNLIREHNGGIRIDVGEEGKGGEVRADGTAFNELWKSVQDMRAQNRADPKLGLKPIEEAYALQPQIFKYVNPATGKELQRPLPIVERGGMTPEEMLWKEKEKYATSYNIGDVLAASSNGKFDPSKAKAYATGDAARVIAGTNPYGGSRMAGMTALGSYHHPEYGGGGLSQAFTAAGPNEQQGALLRQLYQQNQPGFQDAVAMLSGGQAAPPVSGVQPSLSTMGTAMNQLKTQQQPPASPWGPGAYRRGLERAQKNRLGTTN